MVPPVHAAPLWPSGLRAGGSPATGQEGPRWPAAWPPGRGTRKSSGVGRVLPSLLFSMEGCYGGAPNGHGDRGTRRRRRRKDREASGSSDGAGRREVQSGMGQVQRGAQWGWSLFQEGRAGRGHSEGHACRVGGPRQRGGAGSSRTPGPQRTDCVSARTVLRTHERHLQPEREGPAGGGAWTCPDPGTLRAWPQQGVPRGRSGGDSLGLWK